VTDYLNRVDIAVARFTDGARRPATTKCALSVRVFADDKEVWRSFMYIGCTEDSAKHQARGLVLREFLEQ
jgi:hypothetical protein